MRFLAGDIARMSGQPAVQDTPYLKDPSLPSDCTRKPSTQQGSTPAFRTAGLNLDQADHRFSKVDLSVRTSEVGVSSGGPGETLGLPSSAHHSPHMPCNKAPNDLVNVGELDSRPA